MPEQIQEPGRGLNHDDVWAAFRELREFQQETARQMRETDRKMQETDRKMQETAQQMRETDRKMQETDRKMQETDRKISRLGSRIGDLIEHLTAANILERFGDLGYEFTRVSRNNKIKDDRNQVMAELDILLENGDYAMAVEVKSLLTVADVKDHIKRMETLRRYADAHEDRRKYLSSVSGALIEDEARAFALERGIYVIEHAGEAIHIVAPRTVRAW
jgi:hypothetical protein